VSADISAFPLQWPHGQVRVRVRTSSQFKLPLGNTRSRLLHELRLLGVQDIIISSNLELRRDGLPYADSREPEDPGIAVYFNRKIGSNGAATRPFVIACDSYNRAVSNLRAVGVTVEALRTIARHGASSMLEQAFTGFAALPAHGAVKPWWEILGVKIDSSPGDVSAAYLSLVKIHHPDVGGDSARMSEINEAYRQAKERI
jgi:hypothetical protein